MPLHPHEKRTFAPFVCFALLILSFPTLPIHAKVVINEILATTEQEDANGTELEWIELFNTGPEAVNLADYGISDDLKVPKKWRFPALPLAPQAYLRLWATGYDYYNPNDYHLNFRLNQDGEILLLTLPDGTIGDEVHFPRQRHDVSLGRQPDGSETWRYFSTPTPERSNTGTGLLGILDEPAFSREAGIYSQSFELNLTHSDPAAVIHYTLDGAEPVAASLRYGQPLDVTQTVVIRAQALRDNYFASEAVTQTYILRDAIPLPVVSLVTNPKNLFDSRTGIYANPSQHGIQWERPVSMEFFLISGKRAFGENTGLRIHGGASRTRSPKKSFRLYFRDEYGPGRLHYPLFPETFVNQFDRLVLRAGFNDSWGYDGNSQRPTAIFVKDQVVRNLGLDMGTLEPQGIWMELYLNGQYWGLYNLTERIENDFLYQHTGVPEWDVIFEDQARNGDLSEWTALVQWISRVNLRSATGFEEMKARVDLENFVSYMILNTWLQNYDWPHHNWYAYCERTPMGKWKFILWDVEYSFGSGMQGYMVNQNTFVDATTKGPIGSLFAKALQNTEFRAYFWQRVNFFLTQALSEENVSKRLNEQIESVRPVVPLEAQRWGYARPERSLPTMTVADWERAVKQAQNFILQRTRYFLQFAEQYAGPRPVTVEEWSLY